MTLNMEYQDYYVQTFYSHIIMIFLQLLVIQSFNKLCTRPRKVSTTKSIRPMEPQSILKITFYFINLHNNKFRINSMKLILEIK